MSHKTEDNFLNGWTSQATSQRLVCFMSIHYTYTHTHSLTHAHTPPLSVVLLLPPSWPPRCISWLCPRWAPASVSWGVGSRCRSNTPAPRCRAPRTGWSDPPGSPPAKHMRNAVDARRMACATQSLNDLTPPTYVRIVHYAWQAMRATVTTPPNPILYSLNFDLTLLAIKTDSSPPHHMYTPPWTSTPTHAPAYV